MRIVFSGGGTGGHVYPAIAIADKIKELIPGVEILFVGAKDKIEMEKVPKAGYEICGLWISGFHRGEVIRNILFPVKLVHSLWSARKILRKFKPDVVVGVGGFASGPILEIASRMNLPCLIQEQNSFPGITNRLLAAKVDRICVAYDQMERYFPREKLVKTGNPVRNEILKCNTLNKSELETFEYDGSKKTILLFGGSLGARSLNEAVKAGFDWLEKREDVHLIWQVGKLYYEEYLRTKAAQLSNVEIRPYVDRMDEAYAIADIVISRAGALTISELCAVGKPAILVPSPNVAEDHQTKNAKALSEKGAAILVPDSEAQERLIREALRLIDDRDEQEKLAQAIQKLSISNADEVIANEIIRLGAKD